jgi:hypothetical protein
MRSEWLGGFLFESENFRGFIEIFFATLIASYPEAAIDDRARGDGICLGKWDPVPEK